MAEVQQHLITQTSRGEVISNAIDTQTGEYPTFRETNQWWNKTAMTDGRTDGVNWRKLGDKYYKKTDFDTWGVTSVKDWGAVGDGVTDDYDAIQRCINESNNTIILFPQGVYKFTREISLPTSKQIVLRGEGRNSEHGPDFGTGDCIVKLSFIGTDPTVTAAMRSTTGQLNWQFENIYLANNSGRQDVDGLVLDRYVRGAMRDCVFFSFRDNLVIQDFYFYTDFYKCRFGYPWRNNIHALSIANGATFYKCAIQGGGTDRPQSRGFYSSVRTGDIVNFEQCEFESHSWEAIYTANARVVNINGCYIENNGQRLTENNAQVFVGAYTNNFRTTSVVNLTGNHITCYEGTDTMRITPSANVNNGGIKVRVTGNNFVHTNNWVNQVPTPSTNPVTCAVRVTTAADKAHLIFEHNAISRHFQDNPNIYLIATNGTMNSLGSLVGNTCELFAITYPDYIGYEGEKVDGEVALRATRLLCVPQAITFRRGNSDVETRLEIDHPTLISANGGTDFGKKTNTTGRYRTRFFESKGTEQEFGYFNHETGNMVARGFVFHNGAFNPNEIIGAGIYHGDGMPNGSVNGQRGSVYTNSITGRMFIKTVAGSGNTGWEPVPATATGVVNSASPVGSTYSQSEVQAILNELRQLKAQLVASQVIQTPS